MRRSPHADPRVSGPPSPRLRVMTFNVLHSSVRSIARPWSARRPVVAETIRSIDPDVACLQEVSAMQLEDLALDLAEYEFVDGPASGPTILPTWASVLAPIARLVLGDYLETGERCPILLRKDHVTCVDQASFRVPEGRVRGGTTPTPHIVNCARVVFRGERAFSIY